MSSPNTPDEIVLCWALAHLLTHYIDEVRPYHENDHVDQHEVVVEAKHALSKCGYKYPKDFT